MLGYKLSLWVRHPIMVWKAYQRRMNYLNSRIQMLVYIEHGRVWPEVKTCNSDNVEVVVMNNDLNTFWKPRVTKDCDEEVSEAMELVNKLGEQTDAIGGKVRGRYSTNKQPRLAED